MSKVELTGLGESINVHFQCSGCEIRSLAFQGSSFVEGSKRTVVGLALGVAFFLTGHCYANFERTLKQCLCISCISKNRFYDIIKLAYPHIKAILYEMCSEEKERMKELPDVDLGSWKRAVVTSDGVWQTRGHFSKNGSFVIKNYMTGGLLWYGHKCMGTIILWKRTCLKELLNRWKVFCRMSATSRHKSKAALLRWCGRMVIQALLILLDVTIQMARSTNVEVVLAGLTLTI